MARGAFDGIFAAGQALSNAAQGYQNYQTGQEDRATQATNTALQQQYLQQQIDAAQLANQEKQTSIADDQQLRADTIAAQRSQQAPTTQQNAQPTGNPFGLTQTQLPVNRTAIPQPGQQLSAASAPNAAGGVQAANAPSMTAPRGGLPNTQTGVAGGAAPTPFQAALMHAESAGVADATSAKGATGTMQTMPNTLRDPGFGVAPARDDSPAEKQRVGMDYASAMQRRYPEPLDAAAAYNMGPAAFDKWVQGGRKPEEMPIETRNYVQQIGKTLQAQQQQAQGNQLAQAALAKPSPASQVEAAETAGVDLRPVQYSSAVRGQTDHIALLRNVAQRTLASGNVKLAEHLNDQADAAEEKLIELRGKELDNRAKATKETVNQFANVTDQASYDTALSSLSGNPETANVVRGLNVTGNFEADRHVLSTMRDRAQTVAEQNANKIAQDKVQLEKQKDAREQQKIDAPRVAAAQAQQQAQQQDAQRREAAQKAGVPFVPTIAASVASDAKPADVQAARKANEAAWTARDKTYATSEHAQPQVMGEYQNLYNIATQHPEALGGAMIGPRQWAAQHGLVNTLDNNTVDFDKSSNRLVLLLQQSENPAAARSMGTAAMNANIAKTKPQVTMSAPEAAKLALEGYVKAGREVEHSKFIRTMRENNPDISPQVADTYWNHYSQAFPDTIRDPRTGEMVANTAMVPTLPDGTPNPKYQSYADWRKAGAGK